MPGDLNPEFTARVEEILGEESDRGGREGWRNPVDGASVAFSVPAEEKRR
jgi:hypothetical protein